MSATANKRPMTGEEFKTNFDRLMLLCRLLMEEQHLGEMHEIVSHAQTVGPFLDPTAWIHKRGAQNLEEQEAVLDALITAQAALFKIPALKNAFNLLRAGEPHGV
jgi:hypothetical protein